MQTESKLLKIHIWNSKRLCWDRLIYEIDLTDIPIIGYITFDIFEGEVLGCDFYPRGIAPGNDRFNFAQHIHITGTNTRETLCGGMSNVFGNNIYFLFWHKATCPECQRIAKDHPEYLARPIDIDPKSMIVSFDERGN